jgi:hypothetical protein
MQKNNFFKTIAFGLIALVLTLFTSCVKQSGKPAQIAYHDFTQELQKLSLKKVEVSDLKRLKSEYGRFFDVWFSEIMDYSRYKGFSDEELAQVFGQWLQINKPVFNVLENHYKKNTQWYQELQIQWGNLQAHLPKTPTPKLYGFFSQFSNYNTFVDTNELGQLILGFSKEMFLNDTFPLYRMLEVPGFYDRYNAPEQIPTLLVWNYLKSTYESKHKINNMLEQAIFDGKIWALLLEIASQDRAYHLLGYSDEEWARLEKDQGQMWRHYLDQNVLYSKNFNAYRRYFVYGDRTFGPNIPADCPPMIGSFTGYKIVQRYMQEMDVTWEDVFNETDAQKILRLSGYNPAK